MRTRILTAVVIAVALWSPCHIALTHTLDFSSWKLGGFGMFAEPHPGFTHVAVVLFAPNADHRATKLADLPLTWWGPHAGGDSLVQGVYVDEKGAAPLGTGAGAKFDSHAYYSGFTGALPHLVRSVQTLRTRADMAALVDVMATGRPLGAADVIYSWVRVRLGEGSVYLHSCIYVLDHGDVRRGRCFDSDRDPIGALADAEAP